MENKVNPTRDGFHTVTPYMIFQDAARAIEFYKEAFDATELLCQRRPDGKIMHAEIKIGNSPLMLVDETPAFPFMRSPQSLGGSPVHIFLYVENVDELASRATAAGAKVVMEVANAVEGDRRGGFEDPFGYTWWIATHIEDVSLENN